MNSTPWAWKCCNTSVRKLRLMYFSARAKRRVRGKTRASHTHSAGERGGKELSTRVAVPAFSKRDAA